MRHTARKCFLDIAENRAFKVAPWSCIGREPGRLWSNPPAARPFAAVETIPFVWLATPHLLRGDHSQLLRSEFEMLKHIDSFGLASTNYIANFSGPILGCGKLLSETPCSAPRLGSGLISGDPGATRYVGGLGGASGLAGRR